MKYSPEFAKQVFELWEDVETIFGLPYSGTYSDDTSIKITEYGIEHHSVDRWRDGDWRDSTTVYLSWEELQNDDPIDYFRRKFKREHEEAMVKKKAAEERAAAIKLEKEKKNAALKADREYQTYLKLQTKFKDIQN